MLSRRGYSERELRDKLRGTVSEDEIEEILQKCKDSNFLNDARLAEMIAEKYLQKGKGFFFISSILEKRGIPREIAENIKENFDLEREYESAEKFFLKNKGRKPSSLLFSLKNRGFTFVTINKLMSKYGKRTEWTAER